jgi:hypothetical protein
MKTIENKPKEPETVWHYTKMGVLGKIFPPIGNEFYESGKINIRFTNCRYTNDPSESLILKNFLINNKDSILSKLDEDCKKIFKEEIKNDKKIFEQHRSCIFSTSYLKDSFAFWSKEYAGLDGISIGFKKNAMAEQLSSTGNFHFHFHNVNYTNPEIKAIDEELIKKTSDFINLFFDAYCLSKFKKDTKFLPFFLGGFSAFYKHESWEYEKEARVIIPICKAKIELIRDCITKVLYEKIDISVVKSIILGPNCGDEQVEAVEEYLKVNEYDEYNRIRITRSQALDLRYKSTKYAELFEKLIERELGKQNG